MRGRIVKPAQDPFRGGCAGNFQDTGRHVRAIAWNPQLLPVG